MNTITRFFLAFIFLISLAYAENEPHARIFGEKIDSTMKLYWETYEWPAEVQAFNIKKKIGNNKWVTLNKTPIAPQIDNRDWQNIGMNKHQADDFEKVYQRYIADKKLAKSPKEEFIKDLVKYGGLLAGDRINMKSDFNLPLIMGYGFLDSTFKDNEETTYGVFYVYEKNKESTEPVATFKPQKNISVRPTIEFKKEMSVTRFTWQLDESTYKNAAIFGFNVYRMDGSTWTLLGNYDYMRKEEGKFIWEIILPEEQFNSDHLFKITPVNIFQTEFPSITQKYEYSEFQPIPVGKVKVEQGMNDLSVKVTWDTKSLLPFKDRISKIYITRADDITSDDHPILLTDDVWIDSSKKDDRKGYSYVLTVVDRKNNVWKSEYGFLWYDAHVPH